MISAVMGMDQASTLGSMQMAVAKRILDVQGMQGDAAVKLIEAASKSMNAAGDAMVAAATGLGGQIDTYA